MANKNKKLQEKALQQKFKTELEEAYQLGIIDGEAVFGCNLIDYQINYLKLQKLLIIRKWIESRHYKKFGLTQEQFFKAIGEKERTAETLIKELEPILEKFQAGFAYICGLKFSEIKLLCRAKQAEIAYFDDDTKSVVVEGESYGPAEIKKALEIIKTTLKERLEEQKKQAEKEKAEAERQLRIARTHIGHLEEQLREVQDLIPQGRELTESEKRIYVAKEVFKQLQRIIEAIPYDSKLYEKPSIPAQYEGLLNEIKRWIEIEIEKWNMHRRGDYGEGLQRAI